ncbi:hypothetical protein [Desulforhopalus sp. 52FAK]
MKSQFFYVIIVLVCLTGCAAPQQRLQELTVTGDEQESHDCSAVFPGGKWQFSHAIDFHMGNASGTPVIGVTSLNENDIDVALVTVEGLTLFDAVFHHDGTTELRRAIPPFDGPDFAKGLIGDIQMIFQPPTGAMTMGQIDGTTRACRYTDTNGRIVDVLPGVDDCWQIKSYNSELIMDRSIVGRSCTKKGSYLIPDYLELKTYGQIGYTLKLTLITADTL